MFFDSPQLLHWLSMKKRMKFVFVSTMEGYPWGGSEELWSQSAIWLAQNGHEVSASVRFWPQPLKPIEKLAEKGICVQRRSITLRDFLDYGVAKLRRSTEKRPAGLAVFKKWISSKKPHLICFSDGGFASSPLMMRACYDLGVPYVSLGQMNDVSQWPQDDQLEDIQFGLMNARKVFFVSMTNRKMAEHQIGRFLPHAEVVWNPFTVNAALNFPWPKLGENKCWKFACVARLEVKAKGHDLVLQVLAQEKWRSRPFHLTLYGAGPNEKSLRSMVEMLGLQDRVTFAGHIDNIDVAWHENHALVLASRFEGLPLALIEAMLCNRVAIVTNVAGNPDITLDNVTGFLASAPTVEHLDAAIERAWERREEWKSIGRKAGEYIRSLIPEDPAAHFAQKLIDIANEKL